LVGLPLFLMQVGLNASMMGLLIGSGFVAGSQQGRLLSLALIGRAAFVGLNLMQTASLSRPSRGASAAIVAGAAMVAAVSGLSFILVTTLPHPIFDSVLALGLSGVLYLATRDLVLEIGDQDQAGFRTALFCTGYVLCLVLHMATTSRTEPELIP
jgi:zinc transporter, ZIP family